MSEPTLTDTEWSAFQSIPDQGYSHRAWIDARIAEAVDRERAAWAAKVEALEPTWHRGMYGCPDDMFTRRDLRALLAADDTEAQT